VIGLLGDAGPLTYKRSRKGGTLTDRIAEYVLKQSGQGARIFDFEPYGYDERQFCSPGVDLPFGRITRSRNGEYPEYHTSADDLSFIRRDALGESIAALARILAIIDGNQRFINLSPKGEPRLGKRGLYGPMGGTAPGEFQHGLLWLLSLSDGEHDLLAIAERSGLDFALLKMAAGELEKVGLLAPVDGAAGRP
jgi:aminopeptidase-like protein